jgi:hypothetical protein
MPKARFASRGCYSRDAMATVIPINSMRKRGRTLEDQLVASYCRKFQPRGAIELSLVEQLAHDHWQLIVCQSRDPEPPAKAA